MADNYSPEIPRILVMDNVSRKALEPFDKLGWIVDFYNPQDKLSEIIGRYGGILARSSKITAADLAHLKSSDPLRVIARAGVGTDNIAINAATERGIVVCNTPEGSTNAVAELTLTLLLNLARSVPQAHESIRAGRWEKSKFEGIEISGKTLGVLGLGHIGETVATKAKALGMEILGYDPYLTTERGEEMEAKGFELVTFEKLLSGSDFITIHVPSTSQTRDLIGKKELALVKPGAMLINAARGEVIDEEALIEALHNGLLARAALDVFKDEPNISDLIRKHPNIICTPHLGASTKEAQEGVAREAALAIIKVLLKGERPESALNWPSKLTPEEYRKLTPYLPVAESLATLGMWLLDGQRFEQIEAHFLGELGNFADLRPLRAAVVGGLVSASSDQRVNVVNCERIEKERGLKVVEIRGGDTNGLHTNKVEVVLIGSDGQKTSVAGVLAYDENPRVIGINGCPIEFPIIEGKPVLICSNLDQPGRISRVTKWMEDLQINVKKVSVSPREEPEDGTAMMVFLPERVLNNAEIDQLRALEKDGEKVLLSAGQFVFHPESVSSSMLNFRGRSSERVL